MAILNLVSTSSFFPKTEPHLYIPVAVRREINILLETQHKSPRVKAIKVASLLKCVGILPGGKDQFFVGPGNKDIGGYSAFRTQLRNLGYRTVTKM